MGLKDNTGADLVSNKIVDGVDSSIKATVESSNNRNTLATKDTSSVDVRDRIFEQLVITNKLLTYLITQFDQNFEITDLDVANSDNMEVVT